MAELSIQCAHCAVHIGRGRRFCSMPCRVAFKKPEPRPCVRCGAVFTPIKRIRRQAGWQMIAHRSGKTCSHDCHIGWNRENPVRKAKISAAMTGAGHPLWQGGKAQLANASKRGPGWAKARRLALGRDKKCVDCGMTREQSREAYGRDLDVDHVEPFHNFASHKEANRLRNLACRCKSCHRIAEAKRRGVQMLLPFGHDRRNHHGVSRGERHPRSKVTAAQVLEIRRRRAIGEASKSLAAEFGLSHRTVNGIVSGEAWKALR